MNRILHLLSLLILGVVLLPACSKKQADLNKDKPLIVVCEASTSPYCYYNGQDANPPVAGVDIDIVEEIAKELGRPVQYQLRTFPEVLKLVEAGKADIGVAGITITQERAQKLLFSDAYDGSSQVIVVPKNSSIENENMLKSARVAAQAGTSDLDLLRELEPEYVLPFLTQEDINNALVANKADAAVMDRMQAELLVKTTGDTFKVLDKSLSDDKYGIAFNKQSTELAEAANKVIDRLKKDGVIEKSRSKHFDIVTQLGIGAKVEEQVEPFVLCLAVESSASPFAFWTDNNHLAGIDIDIAEAIAAELKRPLIIKIVSFDEVIPLVTSGAADMGASGITVTPERAEKVLFSEPYKEGGRRIMVRDDATFEKLDDLKGKRIGARIGTIHVAFVSDELDTFPCLFDDDKPGFGSLLNKEIDAYVLDETQADLAADKYNEIRPLGISLPQANYAFAFQKGDDKAKAVADKIIKEKRGNGELEKLFGKYNTLCKEIRAAVD